jgi:hypothetical protein
MNHRKSNAPILHCVACGEIVNRKISPLQRCAEQKHAEKRRQQNKYCSGCGDQLIRQQGNEGCENEGIGAL